MHAAISRRRRRVRRFPPGAVWVFVLLIVLLVLRAAGPLSRAPRPIADTETVLVERAVDGDTLLLADGRRVRLLGVDTPETKHPTLPPQPFGEQASARTAELVEGKRVRLEYDRERFDKYGRWLAYVYVGDVLLNELLIAEGLSPAQTAFPYRSDMKRRFLTAQQAAQDRQLGIWGLDPAEHTVPASR